MTKSLISLIADRPAFERKFFHQGIRRDNGCLEWPYSMGHGYGRFRFKGVSFMAHRAAYELASGPIPPKMHVCHRCDNPRCYEPAHLFIGTQAENNADKTRKGRAVRGQAHPSAKFTEDQIHAIRADRRPTKEIAAEYGISQTRVSQIKLLRDWAWLPAREDAFKAPREYAVGEYHHKAKLTADIVREIRASDLPARHFAEKYGVSKNSIWYVRSRRTWGHIDGEVAA